MATLSKIHQRVHDGAAKRKALETFKNQENTFWDDAQNMYAQSLEAIELTHGQLGLAVKAVLSDPETRQHIKDPTLLTQNLNILSRDIDEHVGRINAIYEKHKDRHGKTADPDDVMKVITINGEYADALEVFEKVSMPTVTHIFEQIGAIEELIAAQRAATEAAAQAALADVNIISDVQDKNEGTPNV